MKPKISVVLTTNRLNKNVFHKVNNLERGARETNQNRLIFNKEFLSLLIDRITGVKHILEPTLRSLEKQTFKDFELIISHRYPEDCIGIVEKYDFPIRLVKEKHSIWHDIGEKYHTVANNKNTGLIYSQGELIWHIDDLEFFNEHMLQEIWDLWKDGKYMTGRSYRCIDYNENIYSKKRSAKFLGPLKIQIQHDGWKGEMKPLSLEDEPNPKIPMSSFWTCSATASIKEMLEINGYDELFDGSLAGIDMDAGNRLAMISKYERVASCHYIYEMDDPTKKYITREDPMMRRIFNVQNIRGNSWKPTKPMMRRYRLWHEKEFGSIDPNWNKFMNVPLIDMKEEYELKRLGEVVYEG